MEPVRSRLSPDLCRWCETAPPDERRTVLVRFGYGADPERAAARLVELGLEVASAGPGTVVASGPPGVVAALEDATWVVAVDQPRQFFPQTSSEPATTGEWPDLPDGTHSEEC